MPAPAYPRLFADAKGVWRENSAGRRSGIEWCEIEAVSGHKLDGITEVYTVVELDFVYGEYIELNDAWQGFQEVVDAIALNIPGIDPDWFTRIRCLGIREDPIIVWQRA